MLIGREKEKQVLMSALQSPRSEFIAVYGRRRVGKTFLIRETFDYKFAFQHTGILDAPLREQLSEFRQSLYRAGMKPRALPKTWNEAFHQLEDWLESLPEGKKVVFIDELPWMDTVRSNFIRALDHFWNSWATARKDIVLVVCGSATSWIIDNIVMNYGGLHNRLTKKIHLRPFTLHECELYCKSEHFGYKRSHIMEAYMAIGGIPYYWSFLTKGLSVAQNLDRMFFDEDGELAQEYDALYASLFKNPDVHIAIINALSTKKAGMLRAELLKKANLRDSERFNKALKELEQCGFIRKYTCLGKKVKDAMYQLMDNYTLFYFQFVLKNKNGDKCFWSSMYNSPLHNSWSGLAFERVCLQHIEQIKRGLGFSAVVSTAHSWSAPGAQIDLLIDRNDDVINVCEMKYSKAKYALQQRETEHMQNRIEILQRETGTHKTIMLTLITAHGLTPGSDTHCIQSMLTMDDLFAP
ncbi:MAG: ATP-binding protein [Bacteroidales bacterium]|nr:ATP-binding protein [Bacteroidales bacterium]